MFLEVVCARKILIWWIINSKIAIYLSHFRMNIRFDQLTPTIDWTFGSHFPESSTTPIITGLDVSYLVKFTCCHLWIIRSMATTCFDKTWRDGTHWDEETRRRRSFTIGPPETILVSLRNFTIWITLSYRSIVCVYWITTKTNWNWDGSLAFTTLSNVSIFPTLHWFPSKS